MVRPEHPRPALRRDSWINLNGEWDFGSGAAQRFDRRITVPFCPQSQLSGIGVATPGDPLWYRRRFDAPASERLALHFGAVDYWATVWVNGEEVARHEGGHTPFSVDISRCSGREDNVLVVRAEDPPADRTIPRGKQHWKPESAGIFYTPTSGIWQTVWLEPLPARSIGGLRVTSDLDSRTVVIEATGDGDLEAVVSFGGREVGRRLGGGAIELPSIHPWSPESPNLYDLKVTLRDASGRELDRVDSYFGVRNVAVREGRFWLNGEPFVQRLVLDQGYFPGGLMTAPSDDDLRGDILLAKSMGFNGARKHQKLEDPRWLSWADRLGFLVWDEMAGFHQDTPAARRRLTEEWGAGVRRDREHPCVVAWVPCNESFGLRGDAGAFLDSLYDLTRHIDPTRPVVSNDGWEHATTDLCTLHDYSPAVGLAGRYRSLEGALAPREHPVFLPGYHYAGQPVIVSEFGGVAMAGDAGWHYSEAAGPDGLVETYREMVEALMAPGPVEGFCYTQLTDIEQERNGLLTFDRRPKADPAILSAITQTPKRR
jgi:beta-galactosidase/beta-glucuronidase